MTLRPLAPLSCVFFVTLVACSTAMDGNESASDDGGKGISDDTGGPSAGGVGASSAGGTGPVIGPGTSGSATAGTAGTAIGGSAPVPPDPSTGGSSAGTGGSSSGGPVPGTLTAGAWDDNRNYDFFASYRAAMKRSGISALLPFSDAEYTDAFESFMGQLSSRETLDVALVIDTTGSMGDEMLYLRTEFLALTSAINGEYPNAEQRWSLVVYRDQGDLYVVRSFDFTSDLQEFQQTLSEQRADGGGDIPEAPDQALAKTAELDWRTGDATARLAFWVADAPHHGQNAFAMADAVRAVRDAGVHLYPVASSGVDELSEHSMRSAAQLTGGRYLFLTDDSGVGGAHKEPTIPCYFVTRLDHAILRMVDIELSGVYREPDAAEIIRTGGNPQDGSCALASGDIVFAY
jgi:hypothetical protein